MLLKGERERVCVREESRVGRGRAGRSEELKKSEISKKIKKENRGVGNNRKSNGVKNIQERMGEVR